MEEKALETLSKSQLEWIILEMHKMFSEKQKKKFAELIRECDRDEEGENISPLQVRMSQELVDEKMSQIELWKQQIGEGELYLDTEEYEDYSGGYWDREWITDYYDNHGIGDKIMSMIRFAKDCVEDRRYQEASDIYEWLWEMQVVTDNEYSESIDLEMLEENNLIHADMKELALLTLYADYQFLPPEKRAEDIYLYFSMSVFSKLHIEDMFRMGRESLKDTEQFWKDWIELLKNKNGDTEARLLKEAVLQKRGIEELTRIADENAATHPSLYLSVMDEYEKGHMYEIIENTGKRALDILDPCIKIRGEVALRAAVSSSVLQHEEEMMRFCFEGFRSDSNVKNYLRLFGTEKMAEEYGIQAATELKGENRGNQHCNYRSTELAKNIIDDYEYYRLCFFTGRFSKVKEASKNPKGSLGWSMSFVRCGISLFLLYLYEKALPSKALSCVAASIGFADTKDEKTLMQFEKEILEESWRLKISEFWNYVQRWKRYYPMKDREKQAYLSWAEKIIYSRADAIVGGQHRRQYDQVAVLLAAVGEVKESMGISGARREIFAEYKRKYPRHSSFQREMKNYFNMS